MTFKFKPCPEIHHHINSLDSASTLDSFVKRELELGTGVLTVTDHGSMGACREVYDIAKKNSLTPVLGIEAYLRDDNCELLASSGIEKDAKSTYSSYNKYYHLLVHAMDQQAYEALVKEVSKADSRAEKHGSEIKPLFDWAALERLGQYNVTISSGCLIGVVQRHLLSDRPDIAIKYYDRIRSIPKPGNFVVELFPHRCDTFWESGVFVTLAGGEVLKFWKAKKLKTTLYTDINAEDLAKVASRGKPVGQLIGQMDNRKWQEREPKDIVNVQLVEGPLKNECRSWAPDGDIQLGANKFMLHLAKSRGDKVMLSGDVHLAYPGDKIVQDSKLGGSGGSWRFTTIYDRKGPEEMFAYFNHYMGMSSAEFEGIIENNIEWSQKFKDFKFIDKKSLPASFYPSDTMAHTKALIDKHGRMDWKNPVWVARLKKELTLLHDNGEIDLLPYFFMAEDVCSFYESQGELGGPGRGSSGGMLTAYLMSITHVDPIKYELSEDRFLTIDRIKDLPDIDMDFGNRDLLLDPEKGWLYKRFGENVAAISTRTMLRLKSSIKDVHRALHGRVDSEIEVLCKKLPTPPQGINDSDFIFGYKGDDDKEVKGLLEESKELQEYVLRFPQEWEIVKGMLGIQRGVSRHASAVVICDRPVSDFIPVSTISGVRTTQYPAASVEVSGGVKMDFLGLASLLDIGGCLKLIQQRHGGKITEARIINHKRVPGFRLLPFNGEYYDIWDLPSDQSVFNEIAEGKTETVFQLNTNSAKQWLKVFNHEKAPGIKVIDSIEAISIFTALDRPGPLDAMVTDPASNRSHNMLVEYANRARGLTPIGAIKALDDLIPETKGVMVFQEKLQKVYQYLTDCDGIAANDFRKAIAKKKMDKVLKAYPNFIKKASEKIGEKDAQAVWDQIVTCGNYLFCLAHSTEYAVIAYACAFLKKHYTTEWWCSVLQNAPKDKIAEKFWRYCKHMVDLPDVQYSGDLFEIQNDRIRAPLDFINGVGPAAHAELCAGRPFIDIKDFCIKVAKNKLAGIKPVYEADGITQAVDKKGKAKFRLGQSTLKTGIVSKLIVAGVMDSLFPPESTLSEKFNLFVTSMTDATKEILGKKQAPKLNHNLTNLSPIERFQMKKSILPSLTEDILPILARANIEGISPQKDGKGFSYYSSDVKVIHSILAQSGNDADHLQRLEFVSGPVLKYYNTEYYIENGQSISTVVAAYITAERHFSYNKGKGEKHAVELIFDVDGEQFQSVKWPDRKSGQLTVPAGLEGSIAILMLTKTKNDRPFSIDAVIVVQPPLTNNDDNNDKEESS